MSEYNAKYEKLRHQWAMVIYNAMAWNGGIPEKEHASRWLALSFELADEALSISDDDFREVEP